jgi:hypothetical protein
MSRAENPGYQFADISQPITSDILQPISGLPANVGFGSKADMNVGLRDVRSYPEADIDAVTNCHRARAIRPGCAGGSPIG